MIPTVLVSLTINFAFSVKMEGPAITYDRVFRQSSALETLKYEKRK